MRDTVWLLRRDWEGHQLFHARLREGSSEQHAERQRTGSECQCVTRSVYCGATGKGIIVPDSLGEFLLSWHLHGRAYDKASGCPLHEQVHQRQICEKMILLRIMSVDTWLTVGTHTRV